MMGLPIYFYGSRRTGKTITQAAMRAAYAQGVSDAARAAERLRLVNPMNGDGSNHMLDKVGKALVRLDPEAGSGIAQAKKENEAEADRMHRRFRDLNKDVN